MKDWCFSRKKCARKIMRSKRLQLESRRMAKMVQQDQEKKAKRQQVVKVQKPPLLKAQLKRVKMRSSLRKTQVVLHHLPSHS